MSPLEALQLLDNLASGVQLNRNDHAKVSEAIQVLLKAITPQEEVAKQSETVPE